MISQIRKLERLCKKVGDVLNNEFLSGERIEYTRNNVMLGFGIRKLTIRCKAAPVVHLLE